jgi:hypothetical protein
MERLLVMALRRADRGGVHAGGLLVDHHLDGAVLADLRAHAQRQAHVLALVGLERVDAVGGAAGVGVAAGDEGHVAPDDDLGLLVVQRHQVGRGQHVAGARALQEVGQRAQREQAVDAVPQAQVQALRRHHQVGRRGRAVGELAHQVEDVAAAAP